MLKVRVASGAVLFIILGAGFILGGYALALLMCVISIIGLFEYYRAMKIVPEGKYISPLSLVGYLGTIGYYLLIALSGKITESYIFAPILVCIVLLAVFVFSFPKYRVENIVAAFFGFCYIPLMLGFVCLTRQMQDGIFYVWLVFLASWICDTFAYFTGMLFGKHKLAPVLSPKKSIEGAVGGVIFSTLFGALYGFFIRSHVSTSLPVILICAVVCAFGSAASQIGDLSASAIKRNCEIKDFGKLIPGHGGIVDRFDSVIFTAPIIYLVTYLMQ